MPPKKASPKPGSANASIDSPAKKNQNQNAKTEKEKKPAKEKPPKKKTVGELQSENDKLTADLTAAQTELTTVKDTLLATMKAMVESADKKWKVKNGITASTDLLTLTNEQTTELVDQMVVKHKLYEESVEKRAEDLERRVTEMNFILPRYIKKCEAYEQGLRSILRCCDLDSVRDRVYHLQVLAGEEYHSCDAADPSRDVRIDFKIDGITDQPGPEIERILNEANNMNWLPHGMKKPGDTLLAHMDPNLRLYIVKELSYLKASGADWRTLAVRVGIDQSVVDEWSTNNFTTPASRVLDFWIEQCPKVTVRLLHRHLMSPPMRCTILCRRILDMYCVE